MDVVLAERMLDVVGLLIVFPIFVQLVDLARYVALLLCVKSLLSSEGENKIRVIKKDEI